MRSLSGLAQLPLFSVRLLLYIESFSRLTLFLSLLTVFSSLMIFGSAEVASGKPPFSLVVVFLIFRQD